MTNYLRVDDKWSIRYDTKNNDRPIAWYRYNEYHSNFNENNAVNALFYALLETKSEEETHILAGE